MDVEVAPELIFDQGLGLYYPAVADCYGYYYAGPEPFTEWDSHHPYFGQDSHMPAVQAESLPNVYYIPSYGYVQSPYNPYNPSIPGAVLGTEASFIETTYPTNSPHQLVVSSPAYIPLGIDSSPDTVPNSYLNPFFTSAGALPALKPDGESKKMASPLVPHLTPPLNRFQVSSVHSEHLASNALQLSSGLPHSVPAQKDVSVGYLAPARHSSVGPFINGNVTGVNQGANQLSNVRVSSAYRPAKSTSMQPSNGYTNYVSEIDKWSTGNVVDNFRPRLQVGAPWVNRSGTLPELNRGPRANVARCRRVSPFFVKAYTTKAGAVDAEGNIIISADTYNRDDFPLDYEIAKFFVIKSYSEDDVHKSIKYNVWSSTPSGNKRLENAYEEAQKASLGRPQRCPIFLFYSVNASGQFCGFAEMTGPVDFQKDMDFWQQDKWLGSFPVKWHMVKDVSNTSLRHILLENNEFKPVTCSRDTQEIPFLQGMAMLRIFRSSPTEPSILDDFVHYEERQRILVEEKARISGRRNDNTQYFPALADREATGQSTSESTVKEATIIAQEPAQSDQESSLKSKISLDSNSNASSKQSKTKDPVILDHTEEQFDDGQNSIMKIGFLLIDPKEGEDLSLGSQDDVITVGSMHIKVVGKHAGPSGVSTVSSIPENSNGRL